MKGVKFWFEGTQAGKILTEGKKVTKDKEVSQVFIIQ
jgi:hypothetical protein